MDVASQHNNVGADNRRHEITELNMQITQDMYLQKKTPSDGTKVPEYLTFSASSLKAFNHESHESHEKKQ
jgi:hypothetical protein